MGFNIDDFRSNGLSLGGARPSLFQVNLFLPAGLSIPNWQQKLTFTAQASQVPPSIVNPIEVPYFGRKIKLAGDRDFQNWQITVLNDEDFLVRDGFESWLNSINTHVGNIKNFTNNSYKAQAVVNQYSKGGGSTPIKTYEFSGLFPVNASIMDLNWDATNQIQTFNVELAYDYWIPLTTSGVTIDTGASGNDFAPSVGNS